MDSVDVLVEHGLLAKKIVPGQANRYAPRLERFIELTKDITFKYREQAKDKKFKREHGSDSVDLKTGYSRGRLF